jgi:uncharacterized membrane protein YciS (DUF1049 family)
MKFLWRYISWIFSLPLLLAAVCFAVGNREPTIITFWPLGYIMPISIYLVALLPLAFGLLCGAGMQWFISLRYRLAAQKLGREVAQLKAEQQQLKDKLAEAKAPPLIPENPTERARFKLVAGAAPK